MTKLIAILMIALVLFGAYHLVMYYDKVTNLKEEEQRALQAAKVTGESLSGLDWHLNHSLQEAQEQGATGLRNWLKAHGAEVQDPRKAWIELDYCVLIARDNPAEARRIFADVKARTPPSSRIMPRIKELSKTYE